MRTDHVFRVNEFCEDICFMMETCLPLCNYHRRQVFSVDLQHFVEKFPRVVYRKSVGGVIKEGLKCEIYVLSQCSFDDQFLVGIVLMNQRRNPCGKHACGQWADAIAAEMRVGLNNRVKRHVGYLSNIFHVNVRDQITKPEKSFDH